MNKDLLQFIAFATPNYMQGYKFFIPLVLLCLQKKM